VLFASKLVVLFSSSFGYSTPTWKEKEHPPVPNKEATLQILPLDDLRESKRRKDLVVLRWWLLPKEVLLLVAKLVAKLVVKVVAVLLVVVVAAEVLGLLLPVGVAVLL
jgi:hypothetical protein